VIQGLDYLRDALTRQYPDSTADCFVITNGASEALDLTLRVISNYEISQPKKVLMTKPCYYSYP
jgi:aspartate/methionine/tyrosine aminotransferase